jgi:hypothetical protein
MALLSRQLNPEFTGQGSSPGADGRQCEVAAGSEGIETSIFFQYPWEI